MLKQSKNRRDQLVETAYYVLICNSIYTILYACSHKIGLPYIEF